MILKIRIKLLIVSVLLTTICSKQLFAQTKQSKKPNLIIIHTDEHNLRTIGAYRNTMTDEQAFMWGKEAVVTTPNIDTLAEDGLLCTNWYAPSPVCTPSRASMVS